MSTNVPDNAYLLGTQGGQPIPLQVARPKSSGVVTLSGSFTSVTMLEELNLCTVIATGGFTLVASETILADVGIWTPDSFIGHPDIFYDLILPKTIWVKGSGNITINCLVKWASVGSEGYFRV